MTAGMLVAIGFCLGSFCVGVTAMLIALFGSRRDRPLSSRTVLLICIALVLIAIYGAAVLLFLAGALRSL